MNIQSAIDANPAGTTFCLAAGTYRITTGVIPKTGDALIGEPGATLNGSKLLTTFTREGAYWVAAGQTQQAPVYDATCIPATYTGCIYPEGVYRDDASLRQVTSLADLVSGAFYFDYAADKIYLFDDPAGHKIEASYVPEALRGFSTYQTNITIRGLVVEKFANWPTDKTFAISSGQGWTLENNEVRLNTGGGIRADTGSVVRGNNVHHNGRVGVSTAFADNVLFEANEIAYNDEADFDFWNAGGTKFWDTSNLILRNNYVHDNQGAGLRTDGSSVYVTFEGNTIVDNTGPGIYHEICYDAIIRDNIVRNNNTSETGSSLFYGAQIMVYDSPNVEVYGNTVEALPGTHGIGLRDDDRGSGDLGKWEIRNVYVHDNTIRMDGAGTNGLAGNRTLDVYAGLRWDANTYYVRTTGSYWFWGTGAAAPQTWEQWQGLGHDLTGTRVLW